MCPHSFFKNHFMFFVFSRTTGVCPAGPGDRLRGQEWDPGAPLHNHLRQVGKGIFIKFYFKD